MRKDIQDRYEKVKEEETIKLNTKKDISNTKANELRNRSVMRTIDQRKEHDFVHDLFMKNQFPSTITT